MGFYNLPPAHPNLEKMEKLSGTFGVVLKGTQKLLEKII